jgi:capping protein alpha
MGCMLISLQVIVSEFNKLEDNRYFDSESQTSFEIDHITQVWIQ